MSDSIIKLGAADFQEAIAHLSLVFQDPNFAELVPALYEPTDASMSRNLAVRRHGRIVAIVGLFPIDWVVGGERLRLAGIGGVSVMPEFRGQGLMRLLMDAAMEEIARGGYHAACLGGNRRRYSHWGFEKAGVEASFLVTANSIGDALMHRGKDGRELACVEEAGRADHAAMLSLYERQVVRCGRSAEFFSRCIRNWRRVPMVARDVQRGGDDGRVVAYGCVDPKDSSCVELCCADLAALEAFLWRGVMDDGAWMAARTGRTSMRVAMPLVHDAVLSRLAELSDDASLIEASNWRIYDWVAVIGALMRAKHLVTPLATGECVLRVSGKEAVGLRLIVDREALCVACDDEPDFEADASRMLRVLASPLPPALPGSRGAGPLLAWRPLPLSIPMQDRI